MFGINIKKKKKKITERNIKFCWKAFMQIWVISKVSPLLCDCINICIWSRVYIHIGISLLWKHKYEYRKKKENKLSVQSCRFLFLMEIIMPKMMLCWFFSLTFSCVRAYVCAFDDVSPKFYQFFLGFWNVYWIVLKLFQNETLNSFSFFILYNSDTKVQILNMSLDTDIF